MSRFKVGDHVIYNGWTKNEANAGFVGAVLVLFAFVEGAGWAAESLASRHKIGPLADDDLEPAPEVAGGPEDAETTTYLDHADVLIGEGSAEPEVCEDPDCMPGEYHLGALGGGRVDILEDGDEGARTALWIATGVAP